MCYEIIQTKKFDDDVKYYSKKKKYTKILDDIEGILIKLEDGELVGDEISNLQLSDSTYKVRAINTNTKSGKSNGYRLIYYVVKDDMEIFLITIYSKKDDARIPSDGEIIEWINEYCN